MRMKGVPIVTRPFFYGYYYAAGDMLPTAFNIFYFDYTSTLEKSGCAGFVPC